VSVFRVWVIRIVGETNLARWWARSWFVFVGEVHQVILESGIVMIGEPTRVCVADEDVDVWDGQSPVVPFEWFSYFGWLAEETGALSDLGCEGGHRELEW
jgi:hypothetical protein